MSEAPDAPVAADGPLHGLLVTMAEHVPPATIDRLWIYPPRRGAGVESAVVVLSAADDDDDERLRIVTGRYTLQHDKRGRAIVDYASEEYGAAPVEHIDRVVDGVLRRLGEDLALATPRPVRIRRDETRWTALLDELVADARMP